jgi:hypothetical protein
VKRGLIWGAGWVVVSALAFLLLYWVVALGISIMGLVAVVVAVASSDWENHSTFEEREQVRAGKRKEKYERRAGARAKDRAIWEANRAKKG